MPARMPRMASAIPPMLAMSMVLLFESESDYLSEVLRA